jgi:hypothetical protein
MADTTKNPFEDVSKAVLFHQMFQNVSKRAVECDEVSRLRNVASRESGKMVAARSESAFRETSSKTDEFSEQLS